MTITAKLGAGGMGEVYRARDTTLNRDVAIKVAFDTAALLSNWTASLTNRVGVKGP